MTELKTYSKQKLFEICGSEIPQHKLLVLCVYRTPTSDPNAFLVKLDQLLHYLSRKYTRNTKIVLAGDLNINTLKKVKSLTTFVIYALTTTYKSILTFQHGRNHV